MKQPMLPAILASTLLLSGVVTSTVSASNVIEYGELEQYTQVLDSVSGEYSYKLFGDRAALTAYAGSDINLVLPTKMDDYTVRMIMSGTFSGHKKLKTVLVPEGYETIDQMVFAGQPDLTTVSLPEGLTGLMTGVFSDSTALLTVTIPSTLTTISNKTFENCHSLIEITIPANCDVADNAFIGCSGLQRVYVPEDLELEAVFSSYVSGEGYVSEDSWLFRDSPNVTIYCYENSPAHQYCVTNGKSFVLLDDEESKGPLFAQWAESFVTRSEALGLLSDSLGHDYRLPITRTQIADLLVAVVEKSSGSSLPVGDMEFQDSNSENVKKAAAAGMVAGRSVGVFAPEETASRQEISLMLYKAILLLEDLKNVNLVHSDADISGFTDSVTIVAWAREAMGIMVNHNLISGSGDGKLNPEGTTTIQEALVIALAVMDL